MNIEDLFGRDILAYSRARQNRLVMDACGHWRAAGFPYPSITSAELLREIANLSASDARVKGPAHGLLSTVGLRAANACQPQIWRIKVHGKSCIDIFSDDELLFRALSKAPTFWPNRRCWNAQGVRSLMRISHKMRPSNFRPVMARQLIRAFSTDGDCVLDFSAGFGGRLLGAVSLNRVYVGIDPARAQVAGLQKLQERISRFVPGSARLHRACAEDFLPNLPDGSAQMVFSSPPYFDKERYSTESTQSYRRYPAIIEWVGGFLCPVLQHSARILKPGGIMLLNITDAPRYDLTRIATEMSEESLILLGWLPYLMRANPVGGKLGIMKREPILVFQKPPINRASTERKIGLFQGYIRQKP
jgi:DNA modification methylase